MADLVGGDMALDLKDKLAILRRYTGDRFSAAKGYDLRKGISRARSKTIDRYYSKLIESTARAHAVYRPKRGEKREAFFYSGQEKFPRFDVAFIPVPDPESRYKFSIDKKRPKGSRFIVENRRTRERSWHIPASVFQDERYDIFDPDADPDPEFFQDVLETYAEQGPRYTYVIQAGEHYMWGASGNIPKVSAKLADLFKQYGSDRFDPSDKNSHFIGNWLRGVQVYTDPDEFAVYAMERATKKADWHRKTGIPTFTKYRILKNGKIGVFVRGQLVQVETISNAGDLYPETIQNKIDNK